MRVKVAFIQLLGILFVTNSFSQIPGDLHLELNSSDVKKIDKFRTQFEDAKKMYEKAVSFYESIPAPDTSQDFDYDNYYKKIEEAMGMLFEGMSLFNSATDQVFDIYKKGTDEFWEEQRKENHVPIGLEKARYLELEANIAYEKSKVRRQFAEESKDFLEAVSYVNKANKLDAEALQNMGRALQIYQDFPVEYNYQWTDDIDIEEIIAQKQAERDARNEKLFGKHKKEPKKEEAIIERVPEVVEKPVGEVIFRVQIAAHTVKMEDAFINQIYRGDKVVSEIKEDEWYKYQIGNYKSFAEAQKQLEEANVARAFIVAYQEGKKINVKEARKIAP